MLEPIRLTTRSNELSRDAMPDVLPLRRRCGADGEDVAVNDGARERGLQYGRRV